LRRVRFFSGFFLFPGLYKTADPVFYFFPQFPFFFSEVLRKLLVECDLLFHHQTLFRGRSKSNVTLSFCAGGLSPPPLLFAGARVLPTNHQTR